MVRLNILVEGRSEERFVKDTLAEHLGKFGVFVSARCIQTSRHRHKNLVFRGGCINYEHFRNDLRHWFKEDQNVDAWFSTMIDLYELPENFPGVQDAAKVIDPFRKVNILEHALSEDLSHPRFLPYIQLHEFEALLFANISALALHFPQYEKQIRELEQDCASYDSPDRINDGVNTAPSKRIISKIPEYKNGKGSIGPLVANKIGLDTLRRCLHFDDWLKRVENLKDLNHFP